MYSGFSKATEGICANRPPVSKLLGSIIFIDDLKCELNIVLHRAWGCILRICWQCSKKKYLITQV